MKGLFICSCSGVKERATASFKILFPKEEAPEVYRGDAAILKVANKYPNTNVYGYLEAVSKMNGRFAYFVESDDKGDVIRNYNLLTGKKVA